MRIRQRPFACLLLLSLLAPALTWAQERFLRGEVVSLGTQGDKSPEKGVEVILKEVGNTTTTNDYGIFRLKLSDELKAGWRVTLGVSKQGWVIYAPLEGEVYIPANLTEVIKVQLLPMGSLELLKNRTLIEKFIQDLAEQSKRPTTPEGRPEPLDLGRAIKDWAVKYGFSAQQAREEIDKWIAEVKANEEDLYKLGLAAFAEKQFRKASELFTQSAEQHARQLEAVRREERSLVEKTVRDYRLAGDAHSQETRFAEALQAYERALTYVTRDADPQLWAAVQVDIGGAHQQLGIRTADEAIHHHLTRAVAAYRQALEVYTRATLPQDWATTQNNLGLVLWAQGERTAGEAGTALLAEAVAAYRQALEVYTRATLPQDWAMTQNNLGIVLRAQGERTAGEAGTALLAEAVAAYRQALEVRTRATLPQDWATTQNNLGVVLWAQGERTAGEAGTALLAEAVAAYRQALEVHTRATLPQHWARTQNNLARAAFLLKDWSTAVDSYTNVLQLYPADEEAYQRASWLSHEVLFAFPDAFALNQRWLERHPDDLNVLSDFAEKHFTTGRFAACAERLTALLARPDVQPGVAAALRVLTIPTLLALRQPAQVPAAIDALLAHVTAQTDDFRVTWSFEGVKHFIGQHDGLAPYRPWLQQFFNAVQAERREALVTGLQAARQAFAGKN